MASVYKSISKKKQERLVADEVDEDEDVDMNDLIDEETSDSDDEDEEEDGSKENAVNDSNGQQTNKNEGFMPKTRVLMLTSRGVTHRHRYLLSDLSALLPHTHKENKLDTKKSGGYNMLLNSLAELHSCNVVFFLEARKRGQDLYLWLSRPPNGPTIKFSVTNLHTMGEMGTGFAGNCLKGGRGVVVFDKSFDEKGPEAVGQTGTEYRGLIREMLRKVFCVPKRGVKGMKPFVDRIIGVFGVDGKIWIRVYEIRESEAGAKSKEEQADGEGNKKSAKGSKTSGPEVSLVEIGPRFVLTPIVILEGSFGGPVIYENKEYVSPNQVRRDIRLEKASRYAQRRDVQTDHEVKKSALGLGKESRKRDALDTREVFG
ncbi:60S ribosome biogenesis protein Brx1, putative [Talaromyces stipitatus ATCC 10500]|uniref:60S ribosome biogenesis protein Brx1, putative n=1 Tax=Talaromyces stipitatus (strain ATCC 10500 / CBS 375.48 / QM 6759 / NRRL 1006) TaxID=441959 RepID=B8LZA1_TALSN|nr:60S ribosome biogenesis protein Brx1, putative [Talaromyces stipitatus ATCC 10500]EED21654.1 60S ribosome biogenesis protein Brx1, putative [Talaromyces stipitatus ATCC 10500]